MTRRRMFTSSIRKHDESSPMMSVTDVRGPVTYQSEDHMAVLFQMYGSVWCKVLPYCIVNTFLVFFIQAVKSMCGINLTFNDQGHMFMSTMVSVLLVARVRIAYTRYMTARELLSAIMRSSRELVQYLVTFTRYEHLPRAAVWRGQVSSCTVDLLFDLVDVLQSNKRVFQEMQSSHFALYRQDLVSATKVRHNFDSFHESILEQQQRNPISMAIFLRTAIASHVEYLSRPLDVNQELRLLSCTSDFVSAYHGLVKLITTPFPFPLVQMTRTSLFVWVFSLPFALLSSKEEYFAYLLIFFVTYGFLGLELVSIELDDPFGSDENDIDVKSLAQVVLDDIFICLEDIDGKYAATSLRNDYAQRVAAPDIPESITPLGRLKKILTEKLNPCANETSNLFDNANDDDFATFSERSLQLMYEPVQEQSYLLDASAKAFQSDGQSIHPNYGCSSIPDGSSEVIENISECNVRNNLGNNQRPRLPRKNASAGMRQVELPQNVVSIPLTNLQSSNSLGMETWQTKKNEMVEVQSKKGYDSENIHPNLDRNTFHRLNRACSASFQPRDQLHVHQEHTEEHDHCVCISDSCAHSVLDNGEVPGAWPQSKNEDVVGSYERQKIGNLLTNNDIVPDLSILSNQPVCCESESSSLFAELSYNSLLDEETYFLTTHLKN